MNFFRLIRRKLLSNGRTQNYLFYAAGEILLVMIGILLALQVNNWNESRKDLNKSNQYLKLILKDLENESADYDKRHQLHVSQIKLFENAIDLLYQTQGNISEAVEFYRAQFGQETDDLVPVDATYRQMINSGDMGIIRNEKLSTAIMTYYQMNYDAAAQVKEFNDAVALERVMARTTAGIYQLKYIADLPYNEDKFRATEWSYLNDPESIKFKATENILILNRFREKDHESRMNYLIGLNRELRREIGTAIKR